MGWTQEQQVQHLLRLPWTIVAETTPEGDRLLRVAEIPSAVGTGSTPQELEADLRESLRASLSAYLHFEDPVPLPKGAALPWLASARKVRPPVPILYRRGVLQETEFTAAAGDWRANPS